MVKVARPRFNILFLLAVMTVLVLSGCGASSSEPVQDVPDEENTTESEQQAEEEDATTAQGPEPLESEVELKIGFPTQGASMLPLWVAKDAGFFEKYGIDAELVYIAGTPKVQEVLNGGGIEAGLVGVDPVGKAKVAGHESVIIASVADKVAMYVYGTEDVDEATLQDDLKGETIITAAEGSLYHYLAQEFVATIGLTNDDVEYLHMGGEGDRTAAFMNGEGKALVIAPPTSFKLDTLGYKKVFDFGELDVLLAGIGMTKDYYEENPDVAKAIIAALVEANNEILTNKEDTIEILMNWTGIDDPELAEKTYEANLFAIPNKPLVSDASVEFFLDRSDSEEVRQMQVSDLVDDSIVQELDETGWIDSVMD